MVDLNPNYKNWRGVDVAFNYFHRDCSGGEVLSETPVGPGGANITVNPLNWKQVSLIGPERITLWTLEQCGPQTIQSPM